jgi:fructose-1,6-bisphosphatase I
MSYLIEMAGGLSTNGHDSILNLQPTELHQRVPVFIGSKLMVEQLQSMLS